MRSRTVLGRSLHMDTGYAETRTRDITTPALFAPKEYEDLETFSRRPNEVIYDQDGGEIEIDCGDVSTK